MWEGNLDARLFLEAMGRFNAAATKYHIPIFGEVLFVFLNLLSQVRVRESLFLLINDSGCRQRCPRNQPDSHGDSIQLAHYSR